MSARCNAPRVPAIIRLECLLSHADASVPAHQRVRLTMERLNAATDMVAMSQLVVEEVCITTGHTYIDI